MGVIKVEYTIQQLAKLSGVTTRTLRYYDEIGLLKPLHKSHAGYRMYGEMEVKRLQQILLYRELGLKLEEINEIVSNPNFNIRKALIEQKNKLIKEKTRIEKMLFTIEKTIQSERGEHQMTDLERFEGLKKEIILTNERNFGKEIRGKYRNDVVEKSNAKLLGMSKEQYKENQRLEKRIIELLKDAMKNGDIHCNEAKEAVEYHRKWLTQYWPSYSKEAHKGLADMYIIDERFTVYYDQHQKGMAQFLRDAIYGNI